MLQDNIKAQPYRFALYYGPLIIMQFFDGVCTTQMKAS